MNYTPNTREKFRIVRNNVQMFGLRRTVIDALVHLLRHRDDSFDREHGVATRLTGGSVSPLPSSIGAATSVENGHGYEPTDSLVMRNILQYLQASFTLHDSSFLDLGCGRGRTLLMASKLPFREVIGVELDPEHCAAARENLAVWSRRHGARCQAPVRICCEDVLSFEFPASDLWVYMFNPFRGAVFRGVLDRLEAFARDTSRSVHVVLSNPVMEDMLLAHPAFEQRHEFQVIASGSSWNLWQCNASSIRTRAAASALHVGDRA